MIKKTNRITTALLITIALEFIVSIILIELDADIKYTFLIVAICLCESIILIILKCYIQILKTNRINWYREVLPRNKEVEVSINRKKMKESEKSLCYAEKNILKLSENGIRFYLIRYSFGFSQDIIAVRYEINGEKKEEQVYYETEPFGWVDYLAQNFYIKK